MMSALIPVLFSAAVCLALASIAVTWLAYGASALGLRQQLADCNSIQELRFVTITTLVRQENAEVWRPGFRPMAAQIQTRRPRYRPALRAAA
jgi:hypothetical protein